MNRPTACLAALLASAHGFAIQPQLRLGGTRATLAWSPATASPQAFRLTDGASPTMMLPAIGVLPAQTTTALGLNSFLAAVGTLRGQKVLTPMGLAHAWALGVMLWASLGWRVGAPACATLQVV